MASSSISRVGVAIVTGAAQGIGAAISLRLAKEGYDIALADLPSQDSSLNNVKKEVEASGRKGIVIHADVTTEADVEAMVAKCVEELGELNVMIANAGIVKWGPLVDTPVESWDTIFAVNARGVFLSYKHAARQMIKQGKGGRIIGAGSSAAKRGAPILGAYSASKFAVRGITQVAAQEFAPHGITVNCYSPAFVDTALLSHPDDEKLGRGRGGWIKNTFSLSEDAVLPPEIIADLVSYLVKPAAQIITGELINLTGPTNFD